MKNSSFPRRIICLTEESVEILYRLQKQSLIVGISVYVERPPQAKNAHPKVTAFTGGHVQKIVDLKPDLVIGFSDIQKDLAKELIGSGLNVYISNQRSIADIFDYMHFMGNLVGEKKEMQRWIDSIKEHLDTIEREVQSLQQHHQRPRVYFEEWNEPMITAIGWVSELIELCGGVDIFAKQSQGILAKDRFVTIEEVQKAKIDYFLSCWCGKKMDQSDIMQRCPDLRPTQIYELDPSIFLQPGPAPLEEGSTILKNLFYPKRSLDVT